MPDNSFLQGVQVGSNIMGERLNRDLRYQELKSQDALRRVQERAAAQEMELQLEKRNQQIQYQADMAKGISAFQMAISPVVPVMGPSGPVGVVPNPGKMSPTDAAYKFILPPLAANDPAKVPGAMQDIAMAESRQAAHQETMELRRLQMEREKRMAQPPVARPLAPEQAELVKAKTDTEKARQEELKARTARGTTYAPSEVQKTLEYAKSLGVTFDDEQVNDIIQIHTGLKPKAGTEKGMVSKQVWIAQNFSKAREGAASKKTNDEIVDDLGKIYDSITDQAPETPPQPTEDLIWVTDPAGKTGQIPKKNLEKALKQGFKIIKG